MDLGWVSLLLGVAAGVVSSLIAWAIVFRYLSPKATFSHVLFRRHSQIRGSAHNYQFTVENRRRRAAFELEVNARLTLVRFPAAAPDAISNTFTIPTDGDRLPYLEASRRKLKSVRRISLLLDSESFRQEILCFRPYLPVSLVQKLEESRVSLEELLELAPGSFVRASVMLTDGSSGSRRVYLSDAYTLNRIEADRSYETALRKDGIER